MSKPIDSFIEEVLGEDGAAALRKGCDQIPELSNILHPRAVMSWVSFVAEYGYADKIPGTDNYLDIKKSEDGYMGSVMIDGQVLALSQASIAQVAAAVAVATGYPAVQVPTLLKHADIVTLGQSIDVIIKANAATAALRKNTEKDATVRGLCLCETCATKKAEAIGGTSDHHKGCKCSLCEMAKADPVGTTAKPKAPGQPIAPMGGAAPKMGGATAPKPPKLAGQAPPSLAAVASPKSLAAKPVGGIKPPKPLPGLALKQHELNHKCAICAGNQFSDKKFVGCSCLSALAKSVKTEVVPDGVRLTFGKGWEVEDIMALRQLIRKGE